MSSRPECPDCGERSCNGKPDGSGCGAVRSSGHIRHFMPSLHSLEHDTAVVKAILEDLRYAMIASYGPRQVMENARDGGYELFHTETLEQTGETVRVRLSIEVTKGK